MNGKVLWVGKQWWEDLHTVIIEWDDRTRVKTMLAGAPQVGDVIRCNLGLLTNLSGQPNPPTTHGHPTVT